ncbi:hypothetical protein [Nostoc sp.]
MPNTSTSLSTSAQCPMPNAQCPIPNAQYPMPPIPNLGQYVLKSIT